MFVYGAFVCSCEFRFYVYMWFRIMFMCGFEFMSVWLTWVFLFVASYSLFHFTPSGNVENEQMSVMLMQKNEQMFFNSPTSTHILCIYVAQKPFQKGSIGHNSKHLRHFNRKNLESLWSHVCLVSRCFFSGQPRLRLVLVHRISIAMGVRWLICVDPAVVAWWMRNV